MIRKRRSGQDKDFTEENISEEAGLEEEIHEVEDLSEEEEKPKGRWGFFRRKFKKEEANEDLYAPLSEEDISEAIVPEENDGDDYEYNYADEKEPEGGYDSSEYRYSYAEGENEDVQYGEGDIKYDGSEYRYSYADGEIEVKEYPDDEYRYHYAGEEEPVDDEPENSDEFKYSYDDSGEKFREDANDEYRYHYADEDEDENETDDYDAKRYEYENSGYRYVYDGDEEEDGGIEYDDEDIDEAGYGEEETDESEYDEFGYEKKKISKRLIGGLCVALVAVIVIAVFVIRNLSGGSDGEAYVESVELIAGLGSANGMNNRYTGEVEPQDSWKITLDGELSVKKCYVAVGDLVKKGDKLFSYDTEEVQLSLERQELEVETLQNENTQLTKDIASYEKDVKEANASEKIELQTQILTAQTTIKKNEFSIKSAKDEIKKLKENIKDATVTSKMDGVVNSLNEKLGKGSSSGDESDSSTDSGDSSYMTILATGDYRVKGTINETNVWLINEGDPVIIRSRIDNTQTWNGTINKVKTDSTADDDASSDGMDYGVEGNDSASKYNFYVTLDSDEGLMMGQHVFIELDNGQDDEKDGIWLPTSYLNIDGDDFYVWKDSKGKLKKEEVSVGDYNELLDEYEILSGVSAEDYIACDDMTLEENMKTTKTMPTEENSPEGGTGEMFDGAGGMGEAAGSDEGVIPEEGELEDAPGL